ESSFLYSFFFHCSAHPHHLHSFPTRRSSDLDLDFGAGLLELCLDRVGLVLGDALLDRLRSRVDEVLRLLEAETGDRADDLDHLRSEEHTSELQSRGHLVCRLLLEKKNNII